MATLPGSQEMPSAARLKSLAKRMATLVLLGLVSGIAYDWAAPRIYKPEQAYGFPLGVVHGALMPVALPSLLMGNDVPIYAPNNTGRFYKIGYIAGINLCGLLFFGTAFIDPKKPRSSTPLQFSQKNGPQ
jgi:hypothetical protein